jgi:hypothetical protein
MKKLTLKFTQSELKTFYSVLQNTIANYNYQDETEISGVTGKIYFCHLFALCKKAYQKLFNVQQKYTFSFQMAEAMAFIAFYSKQVIKEVYADVLVSRICGEIHKTYLV